MGVKIKPHPPFFSPSFKAKLGLEKSAFEDKKRRENIKKKELEEQTKQTRKARKRKQNERLTVICKQT